MPDVTFEPGTLRYIRGSHVAPTYLYADGSYAADGSDIVVVAEYIDCTREDKLGNLTRSTSSELPSTRQAYKFVSRNVTQDLKMFTEVALQILQSHSLKNTYTQLTLQLFY